MCHAKIRQFCQATLSAKIEQSLSLTILSADFLYIGQQNFVCVAMVIVCNGK